MYDLTDQHVIVFSAGPGQMWLCGGSEWPEKSWKGLQGCGFPDLCSRCLCLGKGSLRETARAAGRPCSPKHPLLRLVSLSYNVYICYYYIILSYIFVCVYVCIFISCAAGALAAQASSCDFCFLQKGKKKIHAGRKLCARPLEARLWEVPALPVFWLLFSSGF